MTYKAFGVNTCKLPTEDSVRSEGHDSSLAAVASQWVYATSSLVPKATYRAQAAITPKMPMAGVEALVPRSGC